MRGSVRSIFMVPDFDRLREQNRDRTPHKPSNSNNSKGFSAKKSSQRIDNLPNSGTSAQQNATLSDEFTTEDQLFFRLWLEQPSWSPITKNQHGWQTAINASGKKVPLTLGSIESHYRRHVLFGKRFGKRTNYLLIDIDIGSPFHPRNGGIQPILDAMESLGLCRYLIILSSDSGGIHIYFPLAEPVNCWGLACAAHAALTAAGVKVMGGICELFPNKKAYNAEHNGHRLPLQEGSFILDKDFRCDSDSRAVFLQQWHLCADGQDTQHLAEHLEEKPVPVSKQVALDSLPPIAWTNGSESNEVMKKLVNYGDRYLGLKTVPALSSWIEAIAPQLPGFYEFASRESKNDLTRRNWAYRWSKSHFKSARRYAAKISFDYNAMVATEALERLMVALNRIVTMGKFGVKKLWKALSAISKELFGIGFSWRMFQKHRKLIMDRVGSTWKLGLSKECSEDINSVSSELVKPIDSGAEQELEKGKTQLITARSVTPIQGEALNASPTPPEQKGLSADSEAELATGTAVIFQQPGSAVEGVKTRVTGKTIQPDGTRLYRLEEGAESKPLVVSRDCLAVVSSEPDGRSPMDAIRATAAQLLQVLGKNCPFVGPGLWTVKRSEVTPKAWGHLLKLIEREI